MLEPRQATPIPPAPPRVPAAGDASTGAATTAEGGETLGSMSDASERIAGEGIAAYRKVNGLWAPEKWSTLRTLRREVAAALVARGIGRGDRVAVVSQTRWEWGPIDLGILSVGAVTVGVYPTSTPAQVDYILRHSRARLVIVEDQRQVARLREVLAALPGLLATVVIDPGPAADSAAVALDAFRDPTAHAAADARLREVRANDLATLVYTSGTTGPPKAVALTHQNLLATSRLGATVLGARSDDLAVSYLPMAHVLTRVNYYSYIGMRGTAWFAESLEKVSEAWLAARPTMLSTVPRVLEKAQAKILDAIAKSSPLRRRLFARALDVGLRRLAFVERGEPVPFALAAESRLWERVVYRKVRARLGWDRVRIAMTGGAPIRPEVLRFWHALGVAVLEGFGMTETSSPISVNPPGQWRIGTVGRALPGITVKLADDGEILVKSPGLFSRYEDDPEATAAAFDAEGFFKTGDVGAFDADGYLRITDRKRDLIITAGGKNVAPQNIEALLKADPRVSQAAVFGDRRPYLVALVTLQPEALAGLGEAAGPDGALPRGGRAEALVQTLVATANKELGPWETVKKFRVLGADFTIENELLTPTLKVKRRAVQTRFEALIDGLYG